MELIAIALLLLALGKKEDDPLHEEGMKLLEEALRREENGKELLETMRALQKLAPLLRDPKAALTSLSEGLPALAALTQGFPSPAAKTGERENFSSLFSAPDSGKEGEGLAPIAFADREIIYRLNRYFS